MHVPWKEAIGDPSSFLSSFKISIKGKDCKPNLKSDGYCVWDVAKGGTSTKD
jgi:hypothetical protein